MYPFPPKLYIFSFFFFRKYSKFNNKTIKINGKYTTAILGFSQHVIVDVKKFVLKLLSQT